MSAVPTRRRRHLMAAAAVLLTLVLSACTGQRDPSDYSDGVRDNWMAGCTAPAGDEAAGLSEETCGCIYDHVEENMEWSDFAAANSDRREEPTVLEGPGWDEAYEACGVSVGGGDATSPAEPEGATSTTEG